MQPNIKTKDFTVSVTNDWLDKSMQVWSGPMKPGQVVPPNVVVAREQLPKDTTIDTFVNQQMKELMDMDSELDLESRNTIDWQGRNTVEIVFNWTSHKTRLKQRQLYADNNEKGIVSMVFTAAEQDFDNFAPLFADIENSFNWEG